ncbi:unnamed protein product, partial [Leptidea sinapis]
TIIATKVCFDRSRSVTPSTSSYPGTPPERGSPHAPPAPAPPPRNYSDIMRSLAARYNTHPANDYFHRVNGFGVESRPPAPQDTSDTPVGGLFAKLAKQQGGPPRMPAFPALLAVTRVGRGGRSRRKRVGAGAVTEHSPLDLSAAGESAAKRARLSASPSTRSDGDERDRVSNEVEVIRSKYRRMFLLPFEGGRIVVGYCFYYYNLYANLEAESASNGK